MGRSLPWKSPRVFSHTEHMAAMFDLYCATLAAPPADPPAAYALWCAAYTEGVWSERIRAETTPASLGDTPGPVAE